MKKKWSVYLESRIRLCTQKEDDDDTYYECVVVTAHPFESNHGFACLTHKVIELSDYFESKKIAVGNETQKLLIILSGFGFNNMENFTKSFECDSLNDEILEELALLICESAENSNEKLRIEEALFKIRCITGIDLNDDVSDVTESRYNKIKALRTQTGMSQKEFASLFHIPTRTLQEWEQKGDKQTWRRYPPRYVPYMIETILKYENLID